LVRYKRLSATEEDVKRVLRLISERVRYVEDYETESSISANSSAVILEYEVPSGYALEVVAVGVVPDFDPTDQSSGLEYVYFKEGTSGKVIPNMEFYANWFYNTLPFGDQGSRQPIRRFDTPLTKGNLTLKFSEKEKFQVVGVAGSSAAGLVKCRMIGFLLEEADVQSVYGVSIGDFPKLPGGHANENNEFLYAKRVTNSSATSGAGKFEDIGTIEFPDWLSVRLTHIGVKPHAYSANMKIYDEKTKIEFPDRDPYWLIYEYANTLPMGSHLDRHPMQPLPAVIGAYEWRNTTMHIQVKDTGSAIPAGGLKIQLLGVQRRVG